MIESTPEILTLFFAVAMVAGWVDALASGGGMITIPALLLAGCPPATAIATNKLQGSFGTLTAAFYFVRKRAVSLQDNIGPLIAVCLGSVLGGWVLVRVDPSHLHLIVPVLLVAIGIYFLFFVGDLDVARKAKITRERFNAIAAPSLGFYDGFFGPGTGSFMLTAFVTLRGFAIREATAHAKLFNFASNVAALLYFIVFGKILWLVGGAMIGGQMLGAYLGARTALNAGARVIRPVTIIVCFAMSARVLWNLW